MPRSSIKHQAQNLPGFIPQSPSTPQTKMLKALCLVTFLVSVASSEARLGQGSPSWDRRTTADYGYGSYDRSPTFDRDSEATDISPEKYGSATERPSRYTFSWERTTDPYDSDSYVTRSSYLDRFTTARPGSPYDRNRESSDDNNYYGFDTTRRRGSYQTDRWGDAIGGASGTTRRGYATMYTTDNWRDTDFDYGRTTSGWGLGRVTSRWGSATTRSPWGSGSSLSGYDRDRYDRNEAYLRIQFELVKLTNDKGITMDGGKCDTFGSCDTVCYAYVDVERPHAEFPGGRELKYFTKVHEISDNNSPSFSRANVTREVCGTPFREATGRVYCEDHDSLSKSDVINKWDCPLTRDPEFSEGLAAWNSGECRSKTQSDKMKLTFRYKIFSIPRSRCDSNVGGLPAGASTPTTRRRS